MTDERYYDLRLYAANTIIIIIIINRDRSIFPTE